MSKTTSVAIELLVGTIIILSIAFAHQCSNAGYEDMLEDEGILVSPCRSINGTISVSIHPIFYLPYGEECDPGYYESFGCCFHQSKQPFFESFKRFPYESISTSDSCPVWRVYIPKSNENPFANYLMIITHLAIMMFMFAVVYCSIWESEYTRVCYLTVAWCFCMGIFIAQYWSIGFPENPIKFSHLNSSMMISEVFDWAYFSLIIFSFCSGLSFCWEKIGNCEA